MLKFRIYEFDRDYRTVTGTEIKEFKSKEAADEYCRQQSWTGYDYYAKELSTR